MFIVYETTNVVNGKIYVGVHSTDDISDGYLGSGVNLKRAIKKYGRQSFTRKIIGTYQTKVEAFAIEASIVTEDFIKQPHVYNATCGGGGSGPGKLSPMFGKKFKLSDDVKKHLSETKMGELNPQYGRIWTESERQSHSELMKNSVKRGDKSPNYGKKLSPETISKKSATLQATYKQMAPICCLNCGKSMKKNLLSRYHGLDGNKCKNKNLTPSGG